MPATFNERRYFGFRRTRGDASRVDSNNQGVPALIVPTTDRDMHFASAADQGTDWNVSNPTHPTFYLHSETTPATDYASMAHDGDNFILTVFGGGLTLTPAASGDVIIPNNFGLILGNTTQQTLNALIPELQVQGTVVGVDAALAAVLYSATAAEGAEVVLGRSKSATLGTNTIVASGDLIGRILAVGADGGTGFDPAASIAFEVDATPGAATDMPGRIVFLTSPDGSQTQTEVFRVDSAQNLVVADTNALLVGSGTPRTLNALLPEFQVQGTAVGADGAAAVVLYSATAAEGPQLVLARSKSATLGTNTIVADGDLLGRIIALGADGGTGFDPAAAIDFEVAGTPGATTDMPGRIVFLTSPDGSQTPAARMTVLSGATTLAAIQLGTAGTSNGRIGLAGSTSGVVTIQAAAAASSVAYVLPGADGTCGQQLTTNGSGTLSFAAASLGAYKDDYGIVCSGEAFNTIMHTPIHKFKYNKDRVPTGQWAPDYELVGVFGEESPHYMQGLHNEVFSPMKSVSYLTSAVQYLAAKVEALEARV